MEDILKYKINEKLKAHVINNRKIFSVCIITKNNKNLYVFVGDVEKDLDNILIKLNSNWINGYTGITSSENIILQEYFGKEYQQKWDPKKYSNINFIKYLIYPEDTIYIVKKKIFIMCSDSDKNIYYPSDKQFMWYNSNNNNLADLWNETIIKLESNKGKITGEIIKEELVRLDLLTPELEKLINETETFKNILKDETFKSVVLSNNFTSIHKFLDEGNNIIRIVKNPYGNIVSDTRFINDNGIEQLSLETDDNILLKNIGNIENNILNIVSYTDLVKDMGITINRELEYGFINKYFPLLDNDLVTYKDYKLWSDIFKNYNLIIDSIYENVLTPSKVCYINNIQLENIQYEIYGMKHYICKRPLMISYLDMFNKLEQDSNMPYFFFNNKKSKEIVYKLYTETENLDNKSKPIIDKEQFDKWETEANKIFKIKYKIGVYYFKNRGLTGRVVLKKVDDYDKYVNILVDNTNQIIKEVPLTHPSPIYSVRSPDDTSSGEDDDDNEIHVRRDDIVRFNYSSPLFMTVIPFETGLIHCTLDIEKNRVVHFFKINNIYDDDQSIISITDIIEKKIEDFKNNITKKLKLVYPLGSTRCKSMNVLIELRQIFKINLSLLKELCKYLFSSFVIPDEYPIFVSDEVEVNINSKWYIGIVDKIQKENIFHIKYYKGSKLGKKYNFEENDHILIVLGDYKGKLGIIIGQTDMKYYVQTEDGNKILLPSKNLILYCVVPQYKIRLKGVDDKHSLYLRYRKVDNFGIISNIEKDVAKYYASGYFQDPDNLEVEQLDLLKVRYPSVSSENIKNAILKYIENTTIKKVKQNTGILISKKNEKVVTKKDIIYTISFIQIKSEEELNSMIILILFILEIYYKIFINNDYKDFEKKIGKNLSFDIKKGFTDTIKEYVLENKKIKKTEPKKDTLDTMLDEDFYEEDYIEDDEDIDWNAEGLIEWEEEDDDDDDDLSDVKEISDSFSMLDNNISDSYDEKMELIKFGENNINIDDRMQGEGIILSKLYEHDERLFKWDAKLDTYSACDFEKKIKKQNTYTRLCQAARQSIVITNNEKMVIDNDTQFKNTYGPETSSSCTNRSKSFSMCNALFYGSGEQKNWYICPEAWCNICRRSFRKIQLNKEKCPICFNKVIQRDTYFWPGFLDKKKLPNSDLCVPCCFSTGTKKNLKDGVKEKRIQECYSSQKFVSKKKEKDSNYISRQPDKLLKNRHFSEIHKIFNNLFPLNKVNFKNRQLLGKNKTLNHFLRKGILQDYKNSFLIALFDLYKQENNFNDHIEKCSNCNYSSKNDLDIINLITSHTTSEDFYSICGGVLPIIFKDVDYKNRISGHQNFIEYTLSNEQKNFHFYWELLTKPQSWFFKKGRKLIIIDQIDIMPQEKIKKYTLNLICPKGWSYSKYPIKTVSFLIKKGPFFEPIYHTKSVKNKLIKQTSFHKNDPICKKFLELLEQNCKTIFSEEIYELANRKNILNYPRKMFTSNRLLTLNDTLDIITKHPVTNFFNTIGQIIDRYNQIIFVVIQKKDTLENILIPIYPSPIYNNLDILSWDEKYLLSYNKLFSALLNLSNITNNKLHIKPVQKIIYKENCVGIIVESGEIIPIQTIKDSASINLEKSPVKYYPELDKILVDEPIGILKYSKQLTAQEVYDILKVPPTGLNLFIPSKQIITKNKKIIFIVTKNGCLIPVIPSSPIKKLEIINAKNYFNSPIFFNKIKNSYEKTLKNGEDLYKLFPNKNLSMRILRNIMKFNSKGTEMVCSEVILESGLTVPIIEIPFLSLPIRKLSLGYKSEKELKEDYDNINIDNRILYSRIENYDNELYQRMRFELSMYFEKEENLNLKKEVQRLCNLPTILNEKRELLRPIILSIFQKISKIETQKKDYDIGQYQKNYFRKICSLNDEEKCKKDSHCVWEDDSCLLYIPEDKQKNFSLLIEELLRNHRKYEEIFKQNVPYITTNETYVRNNLKEMIVFKESIKEYGSESLYHEPIDCYTRRNIKNNKLIKTFNMNNPNEKIKIVEKKDTKEPRFIFSKIIDIVPYRILDRKVRNPEHLKL